MTREDKILNMIDCIDKNPYKFSVRHLVYMFRLNQEEILKLIILLNLEVLGHFKKNQRRDIEKIIEYNPELTAKQIEENTGYSEYLVYSVGSKIGHRFETNYSIRAKGNKL